MKKNTTLYSIFCLLMIATFSCKKEGSVGPEGPEGPAGSNGSNGSAEGREAVVYAFSTGANASFRWTKMGYDLFLLESRELAAGVYKQSMQFFDTTNAAQNGILLSYLRLTKAPGDTIWVGLPYLLQSDIKLQMDVYKSNLQIEELDAVGGGIATYVIFKVEALINQNGTTIVNPKHTVVGARVILIPSGVAGTFGRVAVDDYQKMTMQQVMEKYKLTESDCKPLY